MSDRLDERIRSTVVELVEASPPPRPYSHVEARRRSGVGLRAGLVRMAAVAAAVLFVGLVGVWIGQNVLPEGPMADPVDEDPTTEELPDGAVRIPEDHLAARLLAEGAGFDEMSDDALMCTRGGTTFGPHTTCLVEDGGLMAVVPLRMPRHMDASIETTAFDEPVVVPLPHASSERDPPDLEELFAVPHEGGRFSVALQHFGESAGAVMEGGITEGEVQPSLQGTIPIPEDHAARALLAPDVESCSDFTRPEGVAMTSQGGGGVGSAFGSEVCLVWDNDVAAVVALQFPDSSWVRVESASLPEKLEVPLAVGEPFAIEHRGGALSIEFYRHVELPEDFGGIASPDFPDRGLIDIPEDHVALEVLEGDPTYREIITRSQEMAVDHLCGRRGAVVYCAIWDDGVVVVVPYSVPDGVTASITSDQRDGELEVDLVDGAPFAYWVGEGWFFIGLERNGESLGNSSTEFPNMSTGG